MPSHSRFARRVDSESESDEEGERRWDASAKGKGPARNIANNAGHAGPGAQEVHPEESHSLMYNMGEFDTNELQERAVWQLNEAKEATDAREEEEDAGSAAARFATAVRAPQRSLLASPDAPSNQPPLPPPSPPRPRKAATKRGKEHRQRKEASAHQEAAHKSTPAVKPTPMEEEEEAAWMLPSISQMQARVFSYIDPDKKDTPANMEGDIKNELQMARVRCCVQHGSANACDFYAFLKFRKRAEDTAMLRMTFFTMYTDLSSVQINETYLQRYGSEEDVAWVTESNENLRALAKRQPTPHPLTLPPLVGVICDIKTKSPSAKAITLAMQMLVCLGKQFRFRLSAHPDHDLMSDAEMYFHHFDYMRNVFADIVLATTLPPAPTPFPDDLLDRFWLFLLKLMGVVALDSQGVLLRRIWYENLISPILLEQNQFRVGRNHDTPAQQVFSIVHASEMNATNTVLVTPIAILAESRVDIVRDCCYLIVFCNWVEKISEKVLVPSIHTLHDARSAKPWSFLFMYASFFIATKEGRFVGPFKTAREAIQMWSTLIYNLSEGRRACETRVATTLFGGTFDSFFEGGVLGGQSGKMFTRVNPPST